MTRRMLPSARESRGAAHMYGSTQHERNPNMFRFRCCCPVLWDSQFTSIYGIRYYLS